MGDSAQAKFLVLSAILRAAYLNTVNDREVDLEELKRVVTNLAGIARKAKEVPEWEHAQLVNAGIFDDIVALLWQITWTLSDRGTTVNDLRNQLKTLHEYLKDSASIAYEALATEMITQDLAGFAPPIQWQGQFEELDGATQDKLRSINKRIKQFTNLSLSPEPECLKRLLAVFFDCYLGFQQRQDTGGSHAYQDVIREPWQRRFRKYRSYEQTGKKFLCTYSGGLDFPLRLNNAWLIKAINRVANAEGKTSQHLVRELGEFLQGLDEQQDNKVTNLIRTPSDLLKALLGYIKVTGSGQVCTSKVDLRNDAIAELWDLIDLMNEVVRDVGGLPTLGGAAVSGAQTLATLGEENVDLLIPFVPSCLLDLLDPKLRIWWYQTENGATRLQRYQPSALRGSKHHPEIHNFIIEFSPGSPIIYCPWCGASVMPQKTDRVIVRNCYAYYRSDGYVDRALTQQNNVRLKVNGLFGFDSSINDTLSSDDCEKLAHQAADHKYHITVVAGLQSLDRSAHSVTERELGRFKEVGTKIHIEVSGDKNLEWLIDVIPKYVSSVGVGEESSLLFQKVKEKMLHSIDSAARRSKEEKRQKELETHLRTKPYGYRIVVQALEVARTLGLERLYVHDTDMDVIIRQGRLNQVQRLKEIRADLIAKWVVLRKLMSRGEINRDRFRDTMTQVKEEGLRTLVETSQALYERQNSVPPTSIELYGIYLSDYDYAVLLVPVRWVYGSLQDQLRVVGAGDTTSVISAAQAI
jgi:hypothetical protein